MRGSSKQRKAARGKREEAGDGSGRLEAGRGSGKRWGTVEDGKRQLEVAGNGEEQRGGSGGSGRS